MPKPAIHDTVTIVGVGLIGGSIGRAVLERGLARRVIGVGRRRESLQVAERLGLVTETTTDVAAAARDADLVIVCTPVGLIVDKVCEAAQVMRPGTLITDAGSTKQALVAAIDARLRGGPHFVGSHPLAGNHTSGPDSATAELFENHRVVITPSAQSDRNAVRQIRHFWEALGAQVRELSPAEHDAVLAGTSHLPHLVASALASVTPAEWLEFTAGGWRDTTRVAAGNVELWLQIVAANRQPVAGALDKLAATIDSMRTAVSQGDEAALRKILEQGKNIRDAVAN